MAEERKRSNTGVIVGILTAVIVAAGGGAAVLTMGQQGNSALENPDAMTGTDPTVAVQSAAVTDPVPPPAPLTPMQPGTATLSPDGSISFIDESLTFSAVLPKADANDPIVKKLQADAQAYLDKKKIEARADFNERKKQGAVEMSWEVQQEWKYSAKAGGIASLVGTNYEFTGGAHGMGNTDTKIVRTDTGEELSLAKMLQADRSPSPAITIAICEGLKAAKMKAIQSATILDEPITCAGPTANVKIEDAHIALAPSTEAERFGGLFVYYDPYAVGSYAEGAYTLTVPQAVFSEDMRPQYKSLFGGTIPPTAKP
jgi:hypothetical protein